MARGVLNSHSPLVMFGNFSVSRFSQCTALLLTVALLEFSGCQCLAPKSAPPVIRTQEIQPPPIEEPDHYAAFRPIMPETLVQPMPIRTVPRQESTSKLPSVEPQTCEPKPDNSAQSKIDELNQKITELETLLAEARKVPPPVCSEDEILPSAPTTDEKPLPVAKSLPIINRPGVRVYFDDSQQVRFDAMDEALFLPNVWQLSAEGEETLRTIAAEIRAFDSKAVLDIEGHTDSLMGDPNNPMQKHEIASAKTGVVMDFFVNALRWDVARIGTSSYGRSRPIVDNGTPEGRARNNRVEIVIRSGEE